MDEFLSLLSSSSPAGWSDLYPSLITSFPAFSLFLNPCFSLSLSIAPSLQSFSYSCFGFPWYLVRQGCNEWHFSLVALGDWDWQPSCLLVSSAGWFKNATRYAHIHSWLVATETPHISCFCLCLYHCNHCTTSPFGTFCFIFIFTQSKHILYVDWERKLMQNVNMDSFLFPPKLFQKKIICPLPSQATFNSFHLVLVSD